MLLDYLTLEDLQLAFLILEQKELQMSNNLLELEPKDWNQLANLLLGLQYEKALSTVH